MALFAVLVAFSSATQDIVIDAFRIEAAEERLQAALAATYMFGYRLAMMVAGAGTLAIAARAAGDSTGYQPVCMDGRLSVYGLLYGGWHHHHIRHPRTRG